jgi:hypothetical protein
MRYLLDELTTYEEGFTDILMNDRASDRHEVFMGAEKPSMSVSHADLQVFGTSLIQQFRAILESPAAGAPVPLTQCVSSRLYQLTINTLAYMPWP